MEKSKYLPFLGGFPQKNKIPPKIFCTFSVKDLKPKLFRNPTILGPGGHQKFHRWVNWCLPTDAHGGSEIRRFQSTVCMVLKTCKLFDGIFFPYWFGGFLGTTNSMNLYVGNLFVFNHLYDLAHSRLAHIHWFTHTVDWSQCLGKKVPPPKNGNILHTKLCWSKPKKNPAWKRSLFSKELFFSYTKLTSLSTRWIPKLSYTL